MRSDPSRYVYDIVVPSTSRRVHVLLFHVVQSARYHVHLNRLLRIVRHMRTHDRRQGLVALAVEAAVVVGQNNLDASYRIVRIIGAIPKPVKTKSVLDIDGKLVSDEHGITQVWRDHFSTVFDATSLAKDDIVSTKSDTGNPIPFFISL